MDHVDLPKYPVINFSKEALKPDSDSWISTSNNVKQAFEQHGFFVAIQDQISSELSTTVFEELGKLFDLPIEMKTKNTSEIPYFGYSGYLLLESFGIEDSTSTEAVRNFTELMWPSGNSKFSELMSLYTKKVRELENIVSKMLFDSYGVNKYHESHIDSVLHLLRLMKYKPPKFGQDNIGAATHTDKNFITIINQNHVNGLEVKTRDGNWVCVDFLPQSLVVMAGDALLAWSNGRTYSVPHRVKMEGEEERYSIAQFSYLTKLIKCPEELVDIDHPLQYKPFDNFGLLRFFSTEEGRKAHNLLKAYCGCGV